MSGVEVKSVLSKDTDCVNILTAGHAVKVLVSTVPEGHGKQSTVPEGCEEQSGNSVQVIVGQEQVGDTSHASKKDVITSHVTRLLTGECSEERVTVEQTMAQGHFLVTFTPELNTCGDYSLALLHDGEHVTGSPFFLRFVDAMSLSYVHVEKRVAVVDAGRPVNLVVPVKLVVPAKEMEELQVKAEGPFGQCEATLHCHAFDEESLSVDFTPKGAGAYTITVMGGHDEIGNSPFLMLADFSSEEAKECHVFAQDEHLFSKPIRFQQAAPSEVSFRVSTLRAAEQSNRSGELTVTCSGPGKAAIHVAEEPGERGVEVCTMVPSRPGDYLLSILWKGQHISGSPCTMKFRRPRSTIASNGLSLHQNTYHLNVPYQFRLNCSEFEGKGPEIVCSPFEAARIDITPVEGRRGVYSCEVLPQLEGTHRISVKIRGKDVEGSPFQVTFQDPCQPSACKIVDISNTYKHGGHLTIKISTAGAGVGELEATAEDPDHKIVVSLDPKKVLEDMYQLELDPGQMSACNLSVTYGKREILGSPFWLVFSNPGDFSLKGEGLLGGVVNRWNTFTVETANPSEQEVGLKVKVRGEHGSTAETKFTALSSKKFQVKYFPPSPGNYVIDVKWGHVPIPGSPFRIKCSSVQFQIERAPKRADVSSQVEVRVRQTATPTLGEEEQGLEVVAKTLKGNELRGVAYLMNEEERLYTCTFTPALPGPYMVGIKSNHLHVRGSPFGVKVISPSKPQHVHVSGEGVEGEREAGKRVEFTVETAAAGGGLLAMRIRGPTRELQFDTVRDASNKRTLHVCYCPPVSGQYTVEVMWAGIHVPGSPFTVNFLPLKQRTALVVVADVHNDNELCSSVVALSPETEEGVRPDSVSVVMEEDQSEPKVMSLRHTPSPSHTSVEVADIISAPPLIQSYSECAHDDHVSVAMEEGTGSASVAMEERANSAYASASTTGSESTCVHRFLPPQDSVESTFSLYTVPELSSRRSSDDQIAIHLEGEAIFS